MNGGWVLQGRGGEQEWRGVVLAVVPEAGSAGHVHCGVKQAVNGFVACEVAV